MSSLKQRLPRGQRNRNIVHSESGVALTEFAFSLPIFLILLLGGLEVANLAMTHMRVNQIAITVADNAGRVRTGIDESNIYELFSGASLVGNPLNFDENGRIVLSSLEPNGLAGADEGQMINWQRCYGALAGVSLYGEQGTGRTDDTLIDGIGREGRKIKAADNTAVMFVEVTYRYTPMISGVYGSDAHDIRYESVFNVRERTNQNITNTQSLDVNECS